MRMRAAYAPDFRELCPLLECSPPVLPPLCDCASQPLAAADAVVGDMLVRHKNKKGNPARWAARIRDLVAVVVLNLIKNLHLQSTWPSTVRSDEWPP